MAHGEKVGTIIYKIFQYMKSNPDIDWKKPESKEVLYEQFPDYSKRTIDKDWKKYCASNDVKKLTEKEILEIRRMLKWWREYDINPLADLLPTKENTVKRTYSIEESLLSDIEMITKDKNLSATDLINHVLKRFIRDYKLKEASEK